MSAVLTSVGRTVGTRSTTTIATLENLGTRVGSTAIGTNGPLASRTIIRYIGGTVGRHRSSVRRCIDNGHRSLTRGRHIRLRLVHGCRPGRVDISRVHRIIGTAVTRANISSLGRGNGLVNTLVPGIGNGTSNHLIGAIIRRLLR